MTRDPAPRGTAEVPTSRLGRLARLGWLSRRAIPLAYRRFTEAMDAPAELRGAIAEEALAHHSDVAEEVFRTLGGLKGLAMKAGQTLSYMDGALPARYRGVYQAVLSRLQSEAPSLPWSAVEPIVAADLGRPVAESFASFEQTPFAAASIGQVHRATLFGGQAVAVKVQYPGVADAIAADMKNAHLMRAFASPMLGLTGKASRENAKEMIDEVAARLSDELDYEREARMQRRFAEIVAGDPDLYVPRVFPERSGPRVLTSELVAGRTFTEVCAEAPQEERDRHAAALTRVMYESIYRHRLFNADPHPGNYLFSADGRLVLLDFGCVKELPEAMVAGMKRYFRTAVKATRTGAAADWADFDRAIGGVFRLDTGDAASFALYREFILYCLEPYLHDEPFEFTPEYTGRSVDLVLEAKKKLLFQGGKLRLPELPAVPADFLFVSRLQWGFYSVLTLLRARANWHRMLPPELLGA